MRIIDEQYLKTPVYGSRSMRNYLRRLGYKKINRKRVQRLMRLMGLEAIYPKPKTSKPHPEHKIYPYLLRGLKIDHPNQVWAADITYIPLKRGFMYLVVVIACTVEKYCPGAFQTHWKPIFVLRHCKMLFVTMVALKFSIQIREANLQVKTLPMN